MNDFWTRLDPGFLEPIWLFFGALAVGAVLLLEMGARRRRRQSLNQFAASHLLAQVTRTVSPFKRRLKRGFVLAAVALLFIAMARPHLLDDWRDENRTGLDVLVAVDCSKSMLTEDVKPNRLERAKLALADLADRLPDNRLGLIAFAGDAFLQCPLTLDHDAFQTAVRELDTDTIPRPGTDIATALEQATLALKSQADNRKILILITDGEDLEGRVLDAAKAAAQAHLKIYTVGVGTPEGGTIPERDEAGSVLLHHDASGQIVQSKLDEATLGQIASLTGGAYLALGPRGEGLMEIYNTYIAPLSRQKFEERREKIAIERFEWPLGAAILLLMAEFLLRERNPAPAAPVAAAPVSSLRRRNRKAVSAVSLVAICLMAGVRGEASQADQGERDYKSGKYEDALLNYRQATQARPERHDLQFDQGDAAYKANDYKEAEDAFHDALSTPDLGLQENSYYNLGNAQFRHGEALQKVDSKKTTDLWQNALTSYESALKLRKSADTQHNYDVVKRKLEQLKQQQQKQDQQKKDGSKGSDQKDQNGKSGDQSGDPSKSQNQDGQKGDEQKPAPGDKTGEEKNGEKSGDEKKDVQAYSGTRTQDKVDPGAKSREEAENLLDSLKDDERQVTARTLNGNNEVPPSPSGKDW